MNRLKKARNVFRTLNNVWKSSQYGRERLKQTVRFFFYSKSLRRILRIFWPNKISNEDLLRQCNQKSMVTLLIRMRWKWIGHVIRRDQNYKN